MARTSQRLSKPSVLLVDQRQLVLHSHLASLQELELLKIVGSSGLTPAAGMVDVLSATSTVSLSLSQIPG